MSNPSLVLEREAAGRHTMVALARDMGMRAMGLTWSPLERHRRLAALIPASTLTIIEDCGHMSTLEQPEAVNAALRWWLTPSPQEARLHLGRPAPA